MMHVLRGTSSLSIRIHFYVIQWENQSDLQETLILTCTKIDVSFRDLFISYALYLFRLPHLMYHVYADEAMQSQIIIDLTSD